MRPATIPPPPADMFQIGPLSVHFYGMLIAVGVLLAVTITRRRYAALGCDPEQVDRTAVWAVGLGFLGARLAYVSTHLGTFAGRPWAVLFIWEGGLALFGGLALGAAAAAWHLRREGGSVPALADAAAPAVPVAQALGRWGNYFNQELYGTPTTVPWALQVEPTHRVEPYARFATFHPTFLYESVWNLGLAALIVWVDARGLLRRRGSLFFLYLAGYGLGRFLVELLRTDTTFRLLSLSRNNWVALLVFLGGLAGLRWWERGAVRQRATPPPH